ncbi:hypothetical protein BD31_I0848 [Candidatus Nitrosopumilus salaria BD31]|uniref:Uncharacterized protein n=1 Tax=Candidatus Nitrosopumilus salarius BD31 TaxID=859350 RepID=I3D219_9ARCH|nr:hypothetical protein BD31_I0848 [Candidatus Nitrosopumilus salaria BD31]
MNLIFHINLKKSNKTTFVPETIRQKPHFCGLLSNFVAFFCGISRLKNTTI